MNHLFIVHMWLKFLSNLTFKVSGEQYESSLSSFALRNRLSNLGHDVKVIMIYPVSLPFNRALLNDTSLDFELTHKTKVRYKSEALDTIRKLLRKNV